MLVGFLGVPTESRLKKAKQRLGEDRQTDKASDTSIGESNFYRRKKLVGFFIPPMEFCLLGREKKKRREKKWLIPVDQIVDEWTEKYKRISKIFGSYRLLRLRRS